MSKRFGKCVLLGLIIAIIASVGITEYQSDQDIINCQISQIQRQQEMLSTFTNDVVMAEILANLKLQEKTVIVLDDLVTIVKNTKNSLPDLIKKVAPSVVYVEALYQWSGSGVIVGPHTVLTARHVVQGAGKLTIETADGKKHEAIGWVEDEENDCGLIFFDPREEFKDIVEFADSNDLQIGDTVFTIGSPFGKQLFNTVTFGIISGLERKIPYFGTCGLVTSDAASNPGNSGGPVFDMRGRIIGIAVGVRRGADGLNILIPANTCRKLLEKKL